MGCVEFSPQSGFGLDISAGNNTPEWILTICRGFTHGADLEGTVVWEWDFEQIVLDSHHHLGWDGILIAC